MNGDPPYRGRGPVHAAWAAVLYGALVFLAVRAVLPAPASTFLYATFLPSALIDACRIDQQLVTARIVEVARTVATRPFTIEEGGQCYPLPQAHTLGEHMYAEGLLAVVPYVLSRDPILTFNATLFLSLWLAACAMYALVYHWTRHAPAAFVAGCLFAFHPLKIGDPVHPFVHANHWTALALLFTHRLFTHNRWRDAFGLVACLGLQLLESFYTVVSLAILGSLYGGYLVVRHLRQLPALAPKLLVLAAAVLLFAMTVFAPYLHTRAVWGLLGGLETALHRPSAFGPRGREFPGYVAGTLAAVALVDRVRRRRRGPDDDPRLPLLVAGVTVAWISIGPFVLPGTRVRIGAPLNAVRGLVPGVDAIRAAANIGDGAQLVVAFLAGVGAARLLASCPARARGAISVALVAIALVELFVPPAAGGFRGPPPLATYTARPPRDLLEVATRLPEGAVLDLPFVPAKGSNQLRGHYLILSAFHLQPTAACHNSFASPLGYELDALVRRLPNGAAADALYALGFRTLLVHLEALAPDAQLSKALAFEALQPGGRFREVARSIGHVAYILDTPLPIHTGFDILTPAPDPSVAAVARPASRLTFAFDNPTSAIYRHPDPLEPTPCLIRWYAAAGALVATERQLVLLPLALGSGDRASKAVALDVPVPDGDYEVTLAPSVAPDTIVGRRRVHVQRQAHLPPPSSP